MKSFSILVSLLISAGIAAGHDDSPLHGEMEGMQRSLRQLSRQYTDLSQKTSSLGIVAEIQRHAETAKTLTPPRANKLSGEEQTKYVASFRQHLDELLKEIGALKEAIASDKTDAAGDEIKKIGQLKDSSHEALGVGKDKKRHGQMQ